MRATVSAYRLTGTLEVAFHTPDGTSHQHIVVNGVHLWINSKHEVQQALLIFEDEDYESNGSLVLGTRFAEVNEKVQMSLIDADEAHFDIELADVDLAGHERLLSTTTQLKANANSLTVPHSFAVDFALRSADGVPIEVVVEGTPDGLRTAVVNLPEVSGVERVTDSSLVHVVWNPRTFELKIRLAGIQPGEGRLWVRVALGESGDLLAVDRARVQPDGSAVASSIVPHKGELGELYVDVTDSPTDIIGTSRYRVRRRAARLEALAADQERKGQRSESEAARIKANSLRSTLGEEPTSFAHDTRMGKKPFWWIGVIVVLALGIIAGWFMRGDNSAAQSSGISTNSSVASTDAASQTSDPVTDVLPTDQSLIVYRDGATRFSGEGNANLAAIVEKVDGDIATIRVQLYDQYERSLGESTPETEQGLLQICQERIGSDTGSGGGNFAIETNIAAYISDSLEESQKLLSTTELGAPATQFIGSLTMTANIIESCEVAQVVNQTSVIEVARSAFESFVIEVPINSTDKTYLVLRVINNRGSASTWTSTDVLEITK